VSADPRPRWLRVGAAFVTLEVMARPGSSRRGVVATRPEAVAIALHSPPHGGKANDELREIIADLAGVARSAVTIERGAGARHKLVRVQSADPAALVRRLVDSIRQAG
jgi:uncharacterized protein